MTLYDLKECGDKQQCRVLALGMFHPLLSTRASWISSTGCLSVAPGALCRPAMKQPYLMQSQPAFIMVTPKTALEYCSQESELRPCRQEKQGSPFESWRQQCHCCQ